MSVFHHVLGSARFASFLLLGLLCLNSRINQKEIVADSARVFSVKLKEVTPLQGLVRFASENRLPVGVVVSGTNELCRQFKSVDLQEASAQQVLDALIPSPEYIWIKEDGVFVLRPRIMPESSSFLLQLRFVRFGSMRTTIQGLGILLNSRIQDLLHPGESSAASILSSGSPEEISPFTLDNVSVQQIANYIVSQGNKGLWILYSVPREHQRIAEIQRIYTFGYIDDVQKLSDLSCSNPHDPEDSPSSDN